MMTTRLLSLFASVALLVAGAAGRASGQTMDRTRYLFLFADNLEQANGLAGSPIRLEGDAWYGGSYNRLWMKVDGDVGTSGKSGELETQALFSHLVSSYWDIQAGVRVDQAWGDERRTRTHLAVGLQGLAPYWFEVETALFVSTAGDVSASLQVSYDLLFTQRLVLEPEVELNASFQAVPAWGTASGFTDTELGLRLRYEVRREFAPYLGYVWQRNLGGTADLLRASGDPWHRRSLVAGVRMWY